jgi:hypothetical protein
MVSGHDKKFCSRFKTVAQVLQLAFRSKQKQCIGTIGEITGDNYDSGLESLNLFPDLIPDIDIEGSSKMNIGNVSEMRHDRFLSRGPRRLQS